MYFLPDIILKFSRRMRWLGHVARMGDLRKGDHLEDGSVEWRVILKWIFSKMGRRLD
jgi:hypothetical protein